MKPNSLKILFIISSFTTLLNGIYFTQAYAGNFPKLFGYNEMDQMDLNHLPQWKKVTSRHLVEDVIEANKNLRQWQDFLHTIKDLPVTEQINKVNWYANTKKYIIDLDNYGEEDYWAIVWEFLANNGDCEDYSITKFYSLLQLGFNKNDLRVLILQDTNLGIAHAVLAVSIDGDVLILDNQSKEVLSHNSIVHYTPLYSVNENQWWLHLPPNF